MAGARPESAAPTILIGDDDPNIRSVLRRFLEEKGYRVETADNGQECLDGAERFAPHLILLDIDMPVMNGLEALQRIRQIKNPPAVMMITGNEDATTARSCMELGACDYIVKPEFVKSFETVSQS